MANKLKVGDKVTYKTDSEYAWCAGSEGVIVELRDEYKDTPANEWQVFYTSPIGYPNVVWWTTTEDVMFS